MYYVIYENKVDSTWKLIQCTMLSWSSKKNDNSSHMGCSSSEETIWLYQI